MRLAVTVMVGSGVPGACPGGTDGVVATGTAPGDEGCGPGAGKAGTSPAGDCGSDSVCAQALTLRDEIRKDVDASNRGRNDTNAPCPQGEMQPNRAGTRN